jgi:hypothetical protein
VNSAGESMPGQCDKHKVVPSVGAPSDTTFGAPARSPYGM